MKGSYIVCTAVLMIVMGCRGPVQQSLPTAITTVAAEDIKQASAQFEDLEGNTVTLADYKGKRVLLNFWATWCRPCIAEMPSLQRTREILEKENYVFLLASDQPVGTIRSFVERKGLEFNFLKYKGSLSDLRINALPTTFIYNEEGEEVDKIIGATEWDAPEMIRKLKEER